MYLVPGIHPMITHLSYQMIYIRDKVKHNAFPKIWIKSLPNEYSFITPPNLIAFKVYGENKKITFLKYVCVSCQLFGRPMRHVYETVTEFLVFKLLFREKLYYAPRPETSRWTIEVAMSPEVNMYTHKKGQKHFSFLLSLPHPVRIEP